ncbi:Methyltransferase [Enhygromyxa salina]|uniref:Methyltransferase n=1 Tax=Enhygromyxa salina TaxID=215803 RepID=A0A0C1ZZN1_9BACT|nr:RNA methyltransferase [Enhygromyxa salina]KIG16633.1 Methyltransferase [Enhygromyxa salina]
MTDRLRLFVACAPGLEDLLAQELDELGVEECAVTQGGVSCFGDRDAIYRINLGSALGLRVLVRMADFLVRDFAKLERVTKALEWERWLIRGPSGQLSVRVRAHAKRSRLYHTKAIVERIERSIARRLKGEVRVRADVGKGPGGGELGDEGVEPTLVQVRIMRDRCTISVDTTGRLLHKRGWRQQTAKAPLREDIAQALLRVTGWQPGMALFDPVAGAGTTIIEAATIAAGLPPGASRAFSCMRQPRFDAARFNAIRDELSRGAQPVASLLGCDRDAGAVEAAQANAARSGAGSLAQFIQRSVGDKQLPELVGDGVALVANPPWGLRTGDPSRLRNLYASLGKLALQLPRPTRVGLVTSEAALAGATKLGLERQLTTEQGGVKIGIWTGVIE